MKADSGSFFYPPAARRFNNKPVFDQLKIFAFNIRRLRNIFSSFGEIFAGTPRPSNVFAALYKSCRYLILVVFKAI